MRRFSSAKRNFELLNLADPAIRPTARIIPRAEHSISRSAISPNALRVLYRLREAGYEAFLVGGCVRDIELGGERNRGIYVLKSRGMRHSNQIREFLLTDHGIDLLEVYLEIQKTCSSSVNDNVSWTVNGHL